MMTIKAFNKDEKGFFCQPYIDKFYYEEGKTYKMDKEQVMLCHSGFHASANFDISETLTYYDLSKTYYGIVDLNVIETDNKESVGDEITILEYLPKDFNVLSQYDKIGEWVYRAGLEWKQFDYGLGLQKLLEIDKTGKWIYMAGIDWQEFDYETASQKLLQNKRKEHN